SHQRVLRIELIVNARAELCAAIGDGNGLAERNDVQILIENRGIDDGFVIDVALLEIEKEGSLLLSNRPAQVAAVIAHHVRRARRRKRIERVQRLIIKAEGRLTAKSIGARFRKYFDT